MNCFYYILMILPKKLISFLTGKLLHVELPGPLNGLLLRTYVRVYNVNIDEAEKPLSEYKSLGAFFIRSLKEGSRKIEGEPISPVDAVLRNAGRVEGAKLPQVKGEYYSLEALLKDAQAARAFDGGLFFNLYLSPRDYHHVHSPAGGTVVEARYIPGHLWPVNEWSLKNVENVFAQNERVVTYMDTAFGRMAVIMVGAFNVGRMSVVYDSFETNRIFEAKSPRGFSCVYNPPRQIRLAERLGTFHMGSSVLLLIEAASPLCSRELRHMTPVPVKYGEALFA